MRVWMLVLFLVIVPALALADHHGAGGEHEGHAEDDIATCKPGSIGPAALEIPDASLERFGLKVLTAESERILSGVRVSGRIVPVDEKLSHINSRFGGVVKEVKAKVGDRVTPETLLATIESNDNLQTFHLRSAIPGLLINRHATLGESVSPENTLFVVADLSEVWAEFAVYKQDVDQVTTGARASVYVASHLAPEEGNVVFFSPITDERTQSRTARVLLKTPDPHLSPGAFVSGLIVTSESPAEVTVRSDSVQEIEGSTVVFVQEGDHFAPRPVVTGSSDGTHTEILRGLKAKERYASGNVFLLKADLGKKEAEHDH